MSLINGSFCTEHGVYLCDECRIADFKEQIGALTGEVARVKAALSGLMQYMGSTVDPDTERRNGTMVEDAHVDSARFMKAYDAAVEVLEP